LAALIEAAEKLEADGRLPHEVLEELEPGTSMGGARPKVTVEDKHEIWLAKLPEKADRHDMQRIEYATLELARATGLRVCGARLEPVGGCDALMLGRFDREWNPDANAYRRYGLVSGLTVIDAEDGTLGRDRWSYLLLADELRRWSVKSNDDHLRNHALLHEMGGWRLSPAYDILPVPLVSLERRDLALEVGRFGRAASLYNILSRCDVFGLTKEEARALIDGMLAVVGGWREFFIQHGVEQRNIAMLEQAMLPPSFFRETPADAV
jgi:serine/threonine-protein kinase HipA